MNEGKVKKFGFRHFELGVLRRGRGGTGKQDIEWHMHRELAVQSCCGTGGGGGRGTDDRMTQALYLCTFSH